MITAPSILAFLFLSPLLMAAGAAATSIPIIIHLLNKRKFRVIVWAAMEWLLAAQRRNARRLKFQRWLLLAIRCLALLIIAAGIAELVLQTPALGNLLGAGQRAVVIVWDDSYSMGYQQGGGNGGGGIGLTAFDKSKRLISDYVDHLSAGDKVLLIRASTVGLSDPSSTAKPSPDHPAISSLVNSARLSDAATHLPEAFDKARQALTDLETDTRLRQLLVVTDFSTSSIHDPKRGAGADNQIEGFDGEKLKKAAQGAVAHATDFHLIDMGVDEQSNMAVTGLVSRRPVIVADIPTELEVEIFNGTDQPKLDVPVSFLLDGVPAASTKINKIEPGSFQNAVVSITPPTVGRHLVEATLGGDLLPVDDTRRLMLNVRKEIPVLLVDGSPGDAGRNSFGSVFYLFAAYAIPTEAKTGSLFAPKIVTELELPTTPLSSYDVIVLSDTRAPGPAMRDSLQKYVHDGGLLMIFPGPQTTTNEMNNALGDSGARLLPATLGQPMKLDSTDQVAQGVAFAPEGFQRNPVMQVFASAEKEGKEIGFTTVETSQYIRLGVPTDGSTETILRYAKKDGTPGDAAVVMKRGSGDSQGTVVLFASTADMTWNTWGAKPSYLPFIHELTFYAMGRGTLGAGNGLTLDVNGEIHLPGDVASSGPWKGPRDTIISVSQQIKDGRPYLSSPPLTMAGTYTPTTGDTRPVVAVNPEAREADIRHVQPAQMAAALGIDIHAILQHPATLDWPSANPTKPVSWLGPTMIATALGLFMLEALLALLFSTYR